MPTIIKTCYRGCFFLLRLIINYDIYIYMFYIHIYKCKMYMYMGSIIKTTIYNTT